MDEKTRDADEQIRMDREIRREREEDKAIETANRKFRTESATNKAVSSMAGSASSGGSHPISKSLPKDNAYIDNALARAEEKRAARLAKENQESELLSNPNVKPSDRVKIRQGQERRQRETLQNMERNVRGENRIKAAIRGAVKKTPAAADRIATGAGTAIVDTFAGKTKNPQKVYVKESKELGGAMGRHAKYPISGKVTVTPLVHKNAIIANPNFTDTLLGRTNQPVSLPKKKGKGKQVIMQGGIFGKLNAFAGRL